MPFNPHDNHNPVEQLLDETEKLAALAATLAVTVRDEPEIAGRIGDGAFMLLAERLEKVEAAIQAAATRHVPRGAKGQKLTGDEGIDVQKIARAVQLRQPLVENIIARALADLQRSDAAKA